MANNIHKEIEDALRFFIDNSNAYSVNGSGFVCANNEPILVKDGNEERNLVVYKEVMVDTNGALIINPFSEGTNSTRDKDWFYEVNLAVFIYRFIDIFNFILDYTDAENVPTKVSKYIAQWSPLVKNPDKMKKDIEIITAVYNNFASVYYDSKNKTAKFRCMLFEGNEKRAKYKVDKRTWKFLTKVTCDLLEVNEDEEDALYSYTYITKVIGYPKLDSTFKLYLKLYNQLNEIFSLMDSVNYQRPMKYAIDLGSFEKYVSNFESYFKVMKNVVQKAPTNQATHPQQTVSVPTTSAGHLGVPGTERTYAHNNVPGAVPYASSVPGPMMNAYAVPGTMPPAMMAASQNVPGPMMYQQPGYQYPYQMVQAPTHMQQGMVPGYPMQGGIPMMGMYTSMGPMVVESEPTKTCNTYNL